jgi:hypothetical protein
VSALLRHHPHPDERVTALRHWMLRKGFDTQQGATLLLPVEQWEPWMPDWASACPHITVALLLHPEPPT